MTQRVDTSQEVFANVIDSVGDGVVVIDRDGLVTLMNPAAEEIAGVSRRQAYGAPFTTLFKGEGALLEMVQKTAATGMSVADHENVVLRKLGKITPVSVITSPLLMSSGERVGTIVVLRDLTSIRELEAAVRHSDRLSSLGTLAAGLAHEIKNPLGGITGAAQLLEMELSDDSELQEHIRVVLKEVKRVNRIVEELLHLAAPRKLQLSRVNIHKVLGDLVLLQKRAVVGKSIVFQQHLDPSIPPVLVDEGLITQLLLNLIRNAVEAVAEEGMVRITSRIVAAYSMTQKGEGRSRMVALDVSDNGPGIPPEVLDNLFTPFFTTKARGTGLGLAICQKIVAEHRGMLKVESDLGRGTTFTVMLPLIQ